MALFDRKGVPEFLLQAAIGEADFNEVVDILIGFALVSMKVGETDFEMHRLVQMFIIIWLQYLGYLEEEKEIAIDSLAKCYLTGRFEN